MDKEIGELKKVVHNQTEMGETLEVLHYFAITYLLFNLTSGLKNFVTKNKKFKIQSFLQTLQRERRELETTLHEKIAEKESLSEKLNSEIVTLKAELQVFVF